MYKKKQMSLKRSRTFLTVITQIRTFSLNLGTSINNFQTTKYSLERSLQKESEYYSRHSIIRTFSGTENSFKL